MLKGLLFPPPPSSRASIGLLIARLVFGGAMAMHGLGKIQSPGGAMGWMGDGLPGAVQLCAVLGEFAGGLGVLVGCLTPLAAAGMASTMAYAAYFHLGKGDPWVATGPGGSAEPAVGYLAVALLFMFAGPGRYSIDAFVSPGRDKS
jgi:putative oxidoreductase